MIKNNIFIPILTIALISSGLGMSTAYAADDPDPCSGEGWDTAVTLAVGGVLADSIESGDTVDVIVNINNDKNPDNHCNINGAEVGVYTPDLTGNHGDLPDALDITLCDPTDAGAAEPPFCMWQANRDDSPGPEQPATFVCYVPDDTDNTTIALACDQQAIDDGNVFQNTALTVTVTVNEGVEEAGFRSCGTGDNPVQDGANGDDLDKCGDANVDIHYPYDIETESDPKGLITDEMDLPVTSVTDTITILGVDTIEGTFDVTKADLVNDDTGVTVGSLGVDVTCDAALTTDMFDAMTTLVCTWTGSALDPATYCWDVTVDDTSDTYVPTEVSHNGCENTGTDPQDDAEEQFAVPPDYDIETESDPKGLITDEMDLPVTSVTDTITILGVDGFEGTFDVTKADLVNDDTGVTVGSLGVDVTCDSALTTDMFDAMTTLECTWTGSALDPATYCWDVTVDDTSDTYVPTEVSHNGCESTGTDPQDDAEEQFTVPGNYDIETESDPKGLITDEMDLPVTSVTDTITILGVDGIEGTFDVTKADLVNDDTGATVGSLGGDVTCDSALTTDMFDAMTTLVCTWTGSALDPATYCWDVTVDDTSDTYVPTEVSHNGCESTGTDPQDDAEEQFTVPPEYDIETESDPKGLVPFAGLPVTMASDTITILGVDGFEGTFDVTKADLVNDDTGATVGSLGGDVTCDSALTTDMFDAMTTLVCTWTGSALDPATYCWDVTVDDTSDTYVPTEVSHNGCENTGTDPQDDTDEQFTVPNPFDFETLSNPMGLITDEMDLPVTSATDTITIDGVNGELGTFQGSAELILIGDGPVAGTVVCLPDTHDIDMFTDNTMVCTWSNGGTELLPGEYCWDVTVVDTSGNYVPDTVRHDGCPRDEDNPYEQFVVPPQYDFETDSDPNGLVDQADLPVTMASDTITILGVDGFEGTFDVTKADLVNDDTGVTVGSLGGDVTCDSALTTDMFDAMTTLECTWTGVALETGNYCWDVTVDDTSNTYLPTEVSHNACATTGDNPEDDSREQFMIAGFEGCTPGYWKQSQHFGSYPDGVFPDDTLAFHGFVPDNGISDTTTLLEALKFGGGKGELGAEKILLRAAVAGFLNEGSLNYGLIDVVGQANTAMDSNDRQTMLTLAGTIDDANNAEDDEGNHLCPFGNDPGPSSSP